MNSTPASTISNYHSPERRAFAFNEHVCAEMLLGVPAARRIGRLVQVRKGVGSFGSDLYLLRLADGSLASFENVLLRKAGDQQFEDAFYRSNGLTPPETPEQPAHPNDSLEAEYTIEGRWPEVGFIVEAPLQPASAVQSFAMALRG